MEPQYSAFWIARVLLAASHIVMQGLENVTPIQVRNFLQAVYSNVQGRPTDLSQQICGISVQAATDVLLYFQQSPENFHRFIAGSPTFFFMFLLLFSRYEKTDVARAIGTQESIVSRVKKFISCLQASLFSLPPSENLKSSGVKGSMYSLLSTFSQGLGTAIDTLTIYPSGSLNVATSKQVIKTFFDESQFPNANTFFPTQTPPTQTQPTQTPPTQTQPTQTPPTQVRPTQTPPTQTPPTQVRPTQTPPTQTPPTQVRPTQTQPTQVRPTQTQPTQVRPTQVRPTQPQRPSKPVRENVSLPPSIISETAQSNLTVSTSENNTTPNQGESTTKSPTDSSAGSQNKLPSNNVPQNASGSTPSNQKTQSKTSNKSLLLIGLATIGVSVVGYMLYQKSKNQ